MVVRLRLQRLGMKAMPFYRIVVADARSKRDGKHIESLGTYVGTHSPPSPPPTHVSSPSLPRRYDPLPDGGASKHVALNFDRVKYWLSVGAQPTEKVRCFRVYSAAVSMSTNSFFQISRLLGMANIIPEPVNPPSQSPISCVSHLRFPSSLII